MDKRLWMYKTSKAFKHILHRMDFDWEHPNCKYEFYSLDLYYYIVFEAIYSIVLDLEISKDRCMNPTRSKEWK